MSKPYVVTDDIGYELKKLAGRGIALPDAEHEKETSGAIIHSLQQVFGTVDVVPSERIVGYLSGRVAESDIPVISMTGLIENGAYGSLCFSRSVCLTGTDQAGNNIYAPSNPGIYPRSTKLKSLREQFTDAAASCRKHSTDVALVDDVVFSGGTIVMAADELAKEGIRVTKVYASILMRGAFDILKNKGIEAVGDYVYDDVTDEVCMRDFVVGCPEGGRNVIVSPAVYASAPYIYPFGDVASWASISEKSATKFSLDALDASKSLWHAIDRKNGRSIQMKELAKPVIGSAPEDHVSGMLGRIAGRVLQAV